MNLTYISLLFFPPTVVLLLMDVNDQLSVLEAASSLSMTTEHAFFTFTKTPYDGKAQSVLGLNPDEMLHQRFFNDTSAPGVSIFDSLFVIAYSFPAYNSTNSSALETVRIKRDVNNNIDFPSFQSNRITSTNQQILLRRKRNLYSSPDDGNYFTKNDTNIENVTASKEKSQEMLNRHQSDEITDKKETVSPPVDKMLQQLQGYTESIHSTQASFEDSLSVAQARRIQDNNADSVFGSSDIKKSQNNKEDVNITGSNNPNSVHQLNTSSDSLENNVKPKTSDSLIFESENHILASNSDVDRQSVLHLHLALAAKFRSKRDIEPYTPSATDLSATYDLVFLLSYAVHLQAKTTNKVPVSEEFIASLANLSFPGRSGIFAIDPEQQVSFDFKVYDFNVTAGVMKPMIHYRATSSRTWVLEEEHPLRWPGGIILSPDECFKQLPGCDEGKISFVVLICHVSLPISLLPSQ